METTRTWASKCVCIDIYIYLQGLGVGVGFGSGELGKQISKGYLGLLHGA